MKLCPNAGATLEETKSSSEQVTVQTVSYFVCEGPGSLLKFGGLYLDQSLFRDTQLGPGDSALSLWSCPLQTQTCFYSEHIIHWFILWGFSLEVHMFVAGLWLCVWGSRFITEEWRMFHGHVTLQRLTAEHWRLCSVFLLITTHLQSERKNTVTDCELKGTRTNKSVQETHTRQLRSLFKSKHKQRSDILISSKIPLRRVILIFIYFVISVKAWIHVHKYSQRNAVVQLYLFNAQYSHKYDFIFTASVQYLSSQFNNVLQSSATAAQCFLQRLWIEHVINMNINLYIVYMYIYKYILKISSSAVSHSLPLCVLRTELFLCRSETGDLRRPQLFLDANFSQPLDLFSQLLCNSLTPTLGYT